MLASLLVVLNHHAPLGTTQDEVRAVFESRCRPFLDVLRQRSRAKAALYHGGLLLEWIAAHEPGYLDDVTALVREGRVELLGGPWNEAILPAIPARDARDQLERTSRFCRERLGAAVEGAWLPRRIWDPGVIPPLAETGHRFALVPAHALPSPRGHHVSSERGHALALFPLHADGGPAAGEGSLVIGDIPDTGVLAALLDGAPTTTFGEVLARDPATGIVHPPASPWRAALDDDPELRLLQGRIAQISAKLQDAEAEEEAPPAELDAARVSVHRAEDAAAWGLGLFDGRASAAAWRELVEAERRIDRILHGGDDYMVLESADVDGDLHDEILCSNPRLAATIDTDAGCLVELTARAAGARLSAIPARSDPGLSERLGATSLAEARAQAIEAGLQPPAELGALVRTTDPTLGRLLLRESQRRGAFVDRFHEANFKLSQLHAAADGDVGDFAGARWDLESQTVEDQPLLAARITLARAGLVRHGGLHGLILRKTFLVPVAGEEVAVEYELSNRADMLLTLFFAPELNLSTTAGHLLGPDGDRAPLDRAELEETSDIAVVDDVAGLRIDLHCDRPFAPWVYPVETVGLGPAGFERRRLGTCLLPRIRLRIPPLGTERIRFALALLPKE